MPVPHPQLVSIDREKLALQFARSGKKQWLLAQQIGVHQRTLSRWLLGRVQRVQPESLKRLATQLGCRLSDLRAAEAHPMSTAASRLEAVRAISGSDLLALLSPSGNWSLAEKLTHALLDPSLRPEQRGRLLNILSIACWRQGRYRAARLHAEAALKAGQEGKSRGVAAKALFNLATLDSLQGRYESAVARFEECVASRTDFETERDFGSALANLSMAYRDLAQLEDALETQRRAARIFRRIAARFNYAVSCAQHFMILLEMGRLREALRFAERGAAVGNAIADTLKPGQMMICQADATALLGDTQSALRLLTPALDCLPKAGAIDPELHIASARVMRLAGHLEQAQARLDAGLADVRRAPLSRGLWLLERARLALSKSDAQGERLWRTKANRVFRECGILRRVRREVVAEQGRMFV